ncbi:hypothetical protein [Aristophania vespae]|uniref:hypothetical protein n=1 Tax=Aristophania vespae TaxID=2697033 RepID=UPI0023512432|nr:hypothetical protein [Aristophania vespae]UMM63164.1 hypothetical protein DM15PD_01190 [Aristophania vespae]
MNYGFWTPERITKLRALVLAGYKRTVISKKLSLPCNVSEGYLGAAIRRYVQNEHVNNQAGKLKPTKKTVVLKKKTQGNLSTEPVMRCLRVIPNNLYLSPEEREQAESEEPLPPFHPLTGIIKLMPKGEKA